MDILNILNKYSSLIIAAATVVVAAATILNIREIKSEKMFRLRKDHTDILKKEIIEPWIERLEEIGEAKKNSHQFQIIIKEFKFIMKERIFKLKTKHFLMI